MPLVPFALASANANVGALARARADAIGMAQRSSLLDL